MRTKLAIVIDFPILDAICNNLSKNSTRLWYWFLVNHKQMPMKTKYILQNFDISKKTLYNCLDEMVLYGLVLHYEGYVYFARNSVVEKNECVEDEGVALDRNFTTFGIYERRKDRRKKTQKK